MGLSLWQKCYFLCHRRHCLVLDSWIFIIILVFFSFCFVHKYSLSERSELLGVQLIRKITTHFFFKWSLHWQPCYCLCHCGQNKSPLLPPSKFSSQSINWVFTLPWQLAFIFIFSWNPLIKFDLCINMSCRRFQPVQRQCSCILSFTTIYCFYRNLVNRPPTLDYTNFIPIWCSGKQKSTGHCHV